jgi:phospholipid transport system substrate-binding protein
MAFKLIMNNTIFNQVKIVIAAFLLSYFNLAIGLTADEIVYETTQEVLHKLEINKARLKTEPEYIQVIVREIIVPHMDFNIMSALALGKHWNKLDDTERACFSNSFKNLLVERYAYILLSYRDQNIHYQPAKPIGEKDYVSIIQTLTRPDTKPLTLEYPMQPDNDNWKVVDLVVDDVSLIRNYRKIFNKEIKQQGFAGFIESFQECH